MPTIHVIALDKIADNPHTIVSIKWSVGEASGSTECEAWRGQHEIELLESAGYTITGVERHQ